MASICPFLALSVRLVQYCSIKRRRFFFCFFSPPSLTSSAFFSFSEFPVPIRLPKSLLNIGIAGAVPRSKVSSLSSESSSSPSSPIGIKSINCSLICSISSSEIFIFLSISSIGFMPNSLAQTRQSPLGSAFGFIASDTKTTAGRFLHFEQSFIVISLKGYNDYRRAKRTKSVSQNRFYRFC